MRVVPSLDVAVGAAGADHVVGVPAAHQQVVESARTVKRMRSSHLRFHSK